MFGEWFLGMTSAWPRVHGLMSMKATVCSSSWTLSEGSSPATILQKMQSSAMAGQATRLEPARAPEEAVEHGAQRQHHGEHEWIAEAPAELRHVLEVHAVDAGQHGGNGEDGDDRGNAPDVVILLHGDLREVRLEDAREQVAVAVELLVHPDQVVVDVAEVGAHLRVNLLVVALREPVDRLHQRRRGAVELEHLALQPVDPLGRIRAVLREDLVLDLLDVLAEAVERRAVVVHHAVHDGVKHRARPVLQQLGVGLERLPDGLERAGLSVPHGEDVLMAEEDQDLADLENLPAVHVAHRLQDDEDRSLEDLELRPLVRMDGVLDGERVEIELPSERLELLLGRLVHADPGELAALPARAVGVVEIDTAVAAAAVLVDRAVDDHPPQLWRSRRARATASARVP